MLVKMAPLQWFELKKISEKCLRYDVKEAIGLYGLKNIYCLINSHTNFSDTKQNADIPPKSNVLQPKVTNFTFSLTLQLIFL